jgi:DNA ligase-1
MATSTEIKNRPAMFTDEGTIADVFGLVSMTSGKLQKEEFLKNHMNPVIEQILADTYGGRKYFVKKYEVLDCGHHDALTIDKDYGKFHSLLDALASRTITGKNAVYAVEEAIGRYRYADQVWLARILDGNLRIGAGNTFSNDSGVTEKYPCCLANVLEKVKNVDILDGTWYASHKLDGMRCHAHVDLDKQTVRFVSRQGKEFTTLDRAREDVLEFCNGILESGQWVLDGEMCVLKDDGSEDFYELMSVARRKDYTIERPRYKVFDIVTEDQFWGRERSATFCERAALLLRGSRIYDGEVIDVIEQGPIRNQADLDEWLRRREEGCWEGIMVRKDVPYEGKRTNNLLKIKPMQDDEYVVTGIIEGDLTYNSERGSEIIHGVSALTIEHKGNEVRVGSGLTRAQRERWIEHPEEIVGKTVTIQYFSESQDSKTGAWSLRFPTLKYVYEGERNV